MFDLKFRAWDNESKTMRRCFMVDGKWSYKNKKGEIVKVKKAKHGNFQDVMAWSGLYDKNRKEIYLGDICIDKDSNEKGIITYHTGAFWFDIFLLGNHNKFIYVVGNIYKDDINA